jgi:hypothetical protein
MRTNKENNLIFEAYKNTNTNAIKENAEELSLDDPRFKEYVNDMVAEISDMERVFTTNDGNTPHYFYTLDQLKNSDAYKFGSIQNPRDDLSIYDAIISTARGFYKQGKSYKEAAEEVDSMY